MKNKHDIQWQDIIKEKIYSIYDEANENFGGDSASLLFDLLVKPALRAENQIGWSG